MSCKKRSVACTLGSISENGYWPKKTTPTRYGKENSPKAEISRCGRFRKIRTHYGKCKTTIKRNSRLGNEREAPIAFWHRNSNILFHLVAFLKDNVLDAFSLNLIYLQKFVKSSEKEKMENLVG